MNRRSASVAGNPVLIGAATVLVVIIAVFLAYNANNGLPFVPTYKLYANVPDAGNLVTGNEVRIGGYRVGIISSIDPVVARSGRVTARLTLKLDTDIDPLPKDSTLIVRPRSAVGLKYLEITRGRSREGYKDGATIGISKSTPRPVEIDEFFNMFDERTRRANQENLRIFGDALAGRGVDLNRAVVELDPLTRYLVPVMANLVSPDTDLRGFIQAAARLASTVAPVAETQADLFRNLAVTFTAFADVARPYLQDSITGGPPAMEAAIRDFPFQRTFLNDSEQLFADLQPGTRALRTSAPLLAEAFTVGTRTIMRASALNERLGRTMRSVEAFAEDPQVPLGIDSLHETVDVLSPTITNLATMQRNCNYVALLLNNGASILGDRSAGDRPQGSWLTLAPFAAPVGPNSEAGPASAPANSTDSRTPHANFLHSNPYPKVGAPGQGGVCMAGNETYSFERLSIGNPAGTPTRTIRVSPKPFPLQPKDTP
ncbi:MlaD family protein [Conexibacter sp. JD483]|uniref:MlaD family protein n=1 Tax=unclassified Conexibacter TaxID=2627773 RepID=UPI0027156444|nr:MULTISPECIES: MlaD family protein [unclassified Conexibacter]MDO8186153.1 MlaD family protein [Conexibacter sp. CPCC 205706]MDO8199643.1 MlaD family protein [Conexibacter sp. CPCC 205762]MDR9369103.1 MlaD family protein [Conexibacter sp. JD483]